MSTKTFRMPLTMLDPSDISETAMLGHILEMSGHIKHDTQLARDGIENSMCRAYLREAEAFEAGVDVGRSEGTRELEQQLETIRTLLDHQNDYLTARAVLVQIERVLAGQSTQEETP